MTFFEFADLNFQNKSYENSVNYSLKRDGEIQALNNLVSIQRGYFRLSSYLKLLLCYFAVRLRLLKAPVNIVPKPASKPELKIAPKPEPPSVA